MNAVCIVRKSKETAKKSRVDESSDDSLPNSNNNGVAEMDLADDRKISTPSAAADDAQTFVPDTTRANPKMQVTLV